jgi:hypothetical protein
LATAIRGGYAATIGGGWVGVVSNRHKKKIEPLRAVRRGRIAVGHGGGSILALVGDVGMRVGIRVGIRSEGARVFIGSATADAHNPGTAQIRNEKHTIHRRILLQINTPEPKVA